MPLRQASDTDLPILRSLKDAAQNVLTAKGSLQVLGDVDETAIGEYWLFSPAPSANSHGDVLQVNSSSYESIRSTYSSVIKESGSDSLLDFFPVGSCRVSAHIPTHIEPHLPGTTEADAQPESGHTYLYLSSVVVHPQLQSLGLGRQMLTELQHLCKSQPHLVNKRLAVISESPPQSIGLDVWAGNDRLRRWYGALGWRHVATVEETDDASPPVTYDVAVFVWP